MFELTVPWYELILRAIIIYVFFFAIFRFSGKKHTGELSRFDLIFLLIIAELVDGPALNDDRSIPALLISASTFVFLMITVNKLGFKYTKFASFVNGKPVILIANGEILDQVLREQLITEEELYEALRMEGISNLNQVLCATLETNGMISVMRKE